MAFKSRNVMARVLGQGGDGGQVFPNCLITLAVPTPAQRRSGCVDAHSLCQVVSVCNVVTVCNLTLNPQVLEDAGIEFLDPPKAQVSKEVRELKRQIERIFEEFEERD
ncbi:hypothetical protein BP422_22015 [Brevibacillus formosus]|uniref:Uncharacterized protein n=1 Tax=Brevibacillus formosus TaxID=54913 RepID=A0A220MMJ7_9BACL|nr:hypothetical protein [Brevibacillus formosus]ASJ55985.1 hypothetical protein BP422_22015 [Brevibacillus formosus]